MDNKVNSVAPQTNGDSISVGGERQCANCGTTSTPLWRKYGSGHFLCNACGLYYRVNGDHRPHVSKISRQSSLRRSYLVCANCNTNKTTMWRRNADGMHVCNACGLFFRLNGFNRPVSMRKDVIRTRKRREKELLLMSQQNQQRENHDQSQIQNQNHLQHNGHDKSQLNGHENGFETESHNDQVNQDLNHHNLNDHQSQGSNNIHHYNNNNHQNIVNHNETFKRSDSNPVNLTCNNINNVSNVNVSKGHNHNQGNILAESLSPGLTSTSVIHVNSYYSNANYNGDLTNHHNNHHNHHQHHNHAQDNWSQDVVNPLAYILTESMNYLNSNESNAQ